MAFSSIFIDGKISNPITGHTAIFNITGNNNEVMSITLGDNVIPYFQNMSITMEMGANTNITINLTPPYEEALSLISKDSEFLRLGNTLGVRWGYSDASGMVSDWIYGFVMQPKVSFGEEITVTIEAAPLVWNLGRIERIRDWSSHDKPRSLSSIINEISQRYGFNVEFLNPESKKEMDVGRDSFVQGGRTDLQFVMDECGKYQASILIIGNRLIIVDRHGPMADRSSVNATFHMYGKIDVSKNIFPMNSFSPENLGALYLQNFQSVMAIPFGPNSDPEKDVEQVREQSDKSTDNAFTSKSVNAPPVEDGKPSTDTGLKSSIAIKPEEDESGRHFCLPLAGEETDQFISNQIKSVNNGIQSTGISASFSSIPIPNLYPTMFAKILGVGDFFSGIYMIKKVDLNIGSGNAEMEVDCYANGLPGSNPNFDAFVSDALKSQTPPDDDTGLTNKKVEAEEQ